jgi:hypothetical protein
MSGGPLLPSSVYFGGASGNAYPAFYTSAAGTTVANSTLEGVGVVASLGAEAPVVMQFNLPESIPTGTLKCRVLGLANAATGTAKLTLTDGATPAGLNIANATFTAETQISQGWATADILVENKVTLSTVATANYIMTVLATYNHTSWTLAAASVWQFSLVWE